jgi:hypothetical protein
MRRVATAAFGRAANSSSLKYVAINRPNIGQANTAKMVISVQTMGNPLSSPHRCRLPCCRDPEASVISPDMDDILQGCFRMREI